MQFIKYLIVGGINTFVGLAFIFLLLWLGVSVYLANLLGYLIGFLISYTLNSKFTFYKSYSKLRFFKFIIGQILAYCINILSVYIFLLFYPKEIYMAQISGVIFYTLSGYFINKFWALK